MMSWRGGQHPSPAPGPGEPDVVLNVGEIVENFDEPVAGLRTAKVIRIVTPDFTRVVDSQGVSEFLKSSDSEFLDLDNDSLRISLIDDYVTLSSDLITEKMRKRRVRSIWCISRKSI